MNDGDIQAPSAKDYIRNCVHHTDQQGSLGTIVKSDDNSNRLLRQNGSHEYTKNNTKLL